MSYVLVGCGRPYRHFSAHDLEIAHARHGQRVTGASMAMGQRFANITRQLFSYKASIPQVVVVLSGSMEPGFYRGDILFLNMGKQPIRTGEVVVFNLDGRDIPIVHRVIKVHERKNGTHIDVLTKVR